MQQQAERSYPKEYLSTIESCKGRKISELPDFYQKIFRTFRDINKEFTNEKNYPLDYDTSPSRYINRRYPDILTVKQQEFADYPAAKIPVTVSLTRINVIAEGPFEDNLDKLLLGLKQNNVSVLIAVGLPMYGNKYFNYMDTAFSTPILYEDFIRNTTSYKTDIPTAFSSSQFRFFRYQSHAYGVFYIMHIPNWPDHGLPAFNIADKKILGIFAAHGNNACLHCSAGVGRAATLLMALMAYQRVFVDQKNQKLSQEAILEIFKQIVRDVKSVKPAAGNDGYQVLTVLGLAEDFHDLYAPPLSPVSISSLASTPNLLQFKVPSSSPQEITTPSISAGVNSTLRLV